MQSFTACMPLLTATSTFGLGRRRWSSPQQCCVRCLRTSPYLMQSNWLNNYSLFVLSLTLVFLPLVIERRIRLHHFTVNVRLHRTDRFHQVLTERIQRSLSEQVLNCRIRVGSTQLFTESHRGKTLHAACLHIGNALVHSLTTTQYNVNDCVKTI